MPCTARKGMTTVSPLTTDLYELNMVQAYLDRGENKEAVFEFFVRRLPATRGFLLAAGLDDALSYLEALQFSDADIAWLKSTGRFRDNMLEYLSTFRFTGDVHAIPEGSVCFPNEPLLRVTAPLPQAQLVESRLINILNFQTLIASKAARMVLAAPDKVLADFGLRTAHGAEAGLGAVRGAQAKIGQHLVRRRQHHARRLGRDQRLEVQDVDQARLDQLRLRQRRGDAQQRFIGKADAALGDGVHVAGKAKRREIL